MDEMQAHIDYLFQLEKEGELNRYILRQYPNIRSNDLKLWKFIMRYRANKTEDSYLKFEIIDKIIFRNKSYERNRSMHNLYKKVIICKNKYINATLIKFY